MAKLIVITNLSLDGVIKSPSRPEEDPRDGFTKGGWAAPYAAMAQSGDALGNMGSLLLGRWTYQCFADYFPNHRENPFSAYLTGIPKYVASTTLREPLAWSNSTLLPDGVRDVARLKAEQAKDLVIFGSTVLIQSLMRADLVDDYVLLFHPLVLGGGRRLFPDGGVPASLALRDVRSIPNGVVIARYHPVRPGGSP